MAATNGGLRIHVFNHPEIGGVFHFREEQIARALERVPGLKDHMTVTVADTESALYEAAEELDVLVAWRFPHREVMGLAPRLRWIHEIGAGIEHLLPLDWLPEDVTLTNSSGAHFPKAAEFIMCSLLMLNNVMPQNVTNQRRHRWVQTFTPCIDGKTLLIIGLGKMGEAGAERGRLLNMNVIGVNRSGQTSIDVDETHPITALHEVLPRADFVLVTAPLTDETRGMLGEEELALMKPDASVINMSRAGLIDYDALAARLTSGHLSGAVLDVFDPEPLPSDSPLWDCDNLIISPHVSSDPLDYTDRVLDIFVENLRRYTEGESLVNVVDARRGY
jgi:phosphoglycerate dehydrogenase-like enzyme